MPFTTTIIDGGLDLINPPQAVKPGRLLDGVNYEVARTRGLHRMDGFEKHDGGPSPSSAGSPLLIVFAQGATAAAYPPGTLVTIGANSPTVAFSSILGTVVSSSDYSDLSIPAVGAQLSISMSAPIPVPLNLIAGFCYLGDAFGAFAHNIISASQGFVLTGIPAPTTLLLGAFDTFVAGLDGGLLGNGSYSYRVTAFNDNGETFASVANSLTIANPTSVTNGVVVAVTLSPGLTGYSIPVASTAPFTVGQWVRVTDGTHSVRGVVFSLAGGLVKVSNYVAVGNSTLIPLGTLVERVSVIQMVWDIPVVPAGVPPITVYGIYGRAALTEQLIETVDIFGGFSVPYYSDYGTITPNGPLPIADTTGSNVSYTDELLSYFNTVSATIQQVPGFNSVNGVFWLRDQLYATRDNMSVTFNAGGAFIPSPGDVYYQGASLATSTFSCRIISYIQTSGQWVDSNAVGTMMVYNETGSISIGVALKNDTLGGSVMVLSVNTATPQTAGLYLAAGGRGATLATQSWQHCDLGWNIHYSQCGIEGADFTDQNTALSETKTVDQYQTTPWHFGTTGTMPAKWTDSSNSFPLGMAVAGDGNYVYVNLKHTTAGPVNDFNPPPFTVTGFGFTDADIPPSATLIGIEIQMTCGAEGLANKYTSNVIDADWELVGVAAGSKPKFNSISPIAAVSAISICAVGTLAPADYNHYTFAVNRDAGAPANDIPVPASLLGYSAITVEDIKTATFGVRYAPTLDNPAVDQSLQFGIDQLRMRATYLAQTNLIYFWNGATFFDGKISAASNVLTLTLSHPFTAIMDDSPNQWTAIVDAAGNADAIVFDGTVNRSGSTIINSDSAPFLPSMVGHQITIYGVGPPVPGTITGTMAAGTNILTITSVPSVLTGTMGSWVVEVPTAQFTNAQDKTLRARISTINVGAGTCTLVASNGSAANSVNGTAGPQTITIYQPVIAKIRQYLSPTQVAIDVPMTHPLPGSFSGSVSTITAPIAIVGPLVSKIQTFTSSSQVSLVDNAGTTVGTTTPGTATINNGSTTLTAATPVFTPAMVGWQVEIPGAGAGGILMVSTIAFYTDSKTVTLTTAAQTNVVAVAIVLHPIVGVTIGLPVLAQAVMHYNLQGSVSNGSASGMLYFAFINSAGVVGGTPTRPILSSEQIRTVPNINAMLDGGVLDASIQISESSSAAALNFMDPSPTMLGVMQPDGTHAPPSKYQSVTKNFYASSGFDAIYGVSGGGPAFYFDGVKTNSSGDQIIPGNFSRMLTGLPIQFETPRQIVYHQGHIILGYYAGIAQSSNAANVLSFNPLLWDQSARLIGFGSNLTGMASVNGDTLAVWTKSMIQMVQGNFNSDPSDPATGNIYTSTLSPTSGGIEYTIQPMANYTFCDFRGITALGATNKYGDFELGHYSADIAPWIIPRVQLSSFFEGPNIGIINSVLIRNKNMSRYLFADGYALSMTFLADNENPQFTIQRYYLDGEPVDWTVVQAFTESLGRDRIFGATDDGTGWVYELERSNGFNGQPITAFAILVPDVGQTPYQNKIYSGLVAFGQAQDYATFTLSRSADYDDVAQATGMNEIDHQFGSSLAFPTGKVKAFKSLGTAPLSIEGTAINLRFDSSSNEQFPHTLQAVSYTVEPGQEQQE